MRGLAAALVLLVGSPAAAEPEVSLGGEMRSILLLRTDSDFDPSERWYDPDGQTEGQAATFLRADVGLELTGHVSAFYQAELGWNAWSRNDPDQWFPAAESYPVLKHRELWSRWSRRDGLAITAGYQHFADASRLFLDHWAGALRIDLAGDDEDGDMDLLFAQLPDTRFEGVDVRENNLVHDSFLFGFVHALPLSSKLTFDGALYAVGDFRRVDRPLYLTTVLIGGRFARNKAWMRAHGLVQLGVASASGVGGEDQRIGAWAAQFGMGSLAGPWGWAFNAFATSPDDDHDGNAAQTAFYGSAKNHSRTLMLTEDELRDRYDNLDERMGARHGAFTVNRAGLLVTDLALGWRGLRWYLLEVVLGGAWVLNAHNALGNRFAGFELALRNELPLGRSASIFLVGQLLVPGGAAAAFVNDVDRDATRPVAGLETGLTARW